jgi:hypothetical protein
MEIKPGNQLSVATNRNEPYHLSGGVWRIREAEGGHLPESAADRVKIPETVQPQRVNIGSLYHHNLLCRATLQGDHVDNFDNMLATTHGGAIQSDQLNSIFMVSSRLQT